MSGTIATYQGFPCRDVRFRRTRGWTADTSSVLLFAVDFPQGFSFVTPSPGALTRPRTQARADLSPIRGRRPPRARPLPKKRRLSFAGPLVMAEVDPEGREYLVAVDLFCVALETVKRDADGSVAVVRAKLVDERFFYVRGFCRRWSFNRTGPQGEPRPDSLKEDGKPWTLGEVAQEISKDLFNRPTLAKYPAEWDKLTEEVELKRYGAAAAALLKISQEHAGGELCLALDESLALWKPGEGKVGYAEKGEGVENKKDFPPGLQLYLDGSGQSRGIEARYPPDFLVVVGGLRIASVRLDYLDPVLVIEGVAFELNEELVRKLTKKKHGLAWLKKFVLAPQAYQNDTSLLPEVVQLFREQAFRLWRLPQVVKEVKTEEPEPFRIQPFRFRRSLADAPQPSFKDVARGRRQAAKKTQEVPGPNAHLLPMLKRAETAAGRRLPVLVETFRFQSVHKAMAASKEAEAAAASKKRLKELRRQISELARRRRLADPFNHREAFLLFQDRYVPTQTLFKLSGLEGVSFERFQTMVEHGRRLDRIKKVSGQLAGQYEKELSKVFETQQSLGGNEKTLWDLAKNVVAFEREVAESRDALERPTDEARERVQQLLDTIQGDVRALARRKQAQKFRTQVRARKKVKPQTAVFLRNLPRKPDPGASVYSAELGIVRTSTLSGWVLKEGVPIAEATSFVPKSPLVTFGTVLRPRIDGKKRPPRPITGSSRALTGHADQSKVPSVLTDRETYYTAAFKRVAPGRTESTSVEKIPKGEGQAIERPDLVELVPLEGQSNKTKLDETSRGLAQELMKQPEQVEAAKYSIARPWPVNCDGVVSGVEIALRPLGKGYVTTIWTGSEAPVEGLGRTRVRVRRGGPSDKAAREGVLP